MEFNDTLSKLQGTICSLGRRGLLLKKDSWEVVVRELEKITQGASNKVKSEIVFFMVLNANLSACEGLENDKLVGHFTNILEFPIDKYHLIKYICHLGLQENLFRIIENCPGIIGIELIEAIMSEWTDSIFYHKFGINHLYQLWEAIFVKICKITVRKLYDIGSEFVSYFSIILEQIHEKIKTSILVEGSEKVVGCHLYNFFRSYLFFLELLETNSLPDDPLYELSVNFDSGKIYNNEDLRKECLYLVLEKLHEILERFTLQLWMTFSEIYFDFDSKNSVQLLIGIKVAKIVEKLKMLNFSTHCLNALSNFAINNIAIPGLDEIIFNMKKGEREWFKTLLEHPSVTEEKSITCLLEMIDLASENDLCKILNMSYECIYKEENESLDVMKVLFLTALKKVDNSLIWLEKVFEKYKPDLLLTADTMNDLTKTFNKISREKNIPTNELIILCMQSPKETIKKICSLAVCGTLKTEDVIEILKILQIPCNFIHCDGCTCLDDVILNSILTEDLTDKEGYSLIRLVEEMARNNLLGLFFPNLMVDALKCHLEGLDFEKTLLCLKIVETLLQSELLAIDEVVLLVFLSQVLGHFAWDLESFSTLKADGRDLVISIVSRIINRLENRENAASKHQWARAEILKSSEITGVCFCSLWVKFGQNWPCSRKIYSCVLTLAHSSQKTSDLQEFLVSINQPLEKRASIVLSLIVLLPVLTFREWSSIFDGLITVSKSVCSVKDDVVIHHDVLDMFGACLYLLTLNLKKRETYPCYEYCLRNFGKLVRQCCSKMNAEFLVKTFERIVFVLGAITDEHEKESCWTIVTPVLLEIVDFLKEKNAVDDHREEIEKLLAVSDVKELAQSVAKRLA